MENIQQKKLFQSLALLATLISAFVAVRIVAEVHAYRFIGADIAPTRTINVSGTGDIFAIPDIANISFGASADAAAVAAAQQPVTTKINAAIAMLKANGIADADIQTTDYSANPKYDIQPPCVSAFCPTLTSKIIGYTVNQTIAVKVRDTNKTAAILDGLAKAGVSNISGPDFTIDDQDTVNAQARAKAIDNAKAKAETLAAELGVRLGRVVNFNESSYPIYYDKAFSSAGATPAAAPMPQVPTGQNKITSNVSITYEIQ